jgi:hypothetical protein
VTPSLFLRRHGRTLAVLAVPVPVVIGLVFLIWPQLGAETAYYTPGVTPTREDCALAKMKDYARLDRQILLNIAQECELTVQSIEGHERLRKAWEERQAARQAEPKPAPAAPAPEPDTPQGDTLRRVWR